MPSGTDAQRSESFKRVSRRTDLERNGDLRPAGRLPRASDYLTGDYTKRDASEETELLIDSRAIATTLSQLQILQAIKKVIAQNRTSVFDRVVTRQDIERLVRVPGATLSGYLDKLEENHLITPYRNRTWIFGVSAKQEQLIDYVIEQWKLAVQL